MAPKNANSQGVRVAFLAFLGEDAAESPFCPRMPRRDLAFLGAARSLASEVPGRARARSPPARGPTECQPSRR